MRPTSGPGLARISFREDSEGDAQHYPGTVRGLGMTEWSRAPVDGDILLHPMTRNELSLCSRHYSWMQGTLPTVVNITLTWVCTVTRPP